MTVSSKWLYLAGKWWRPKPSEPIKVLVAHFQVYLKVGSVHADVLVAPVDCNHRAGRLERGSKLAFN
jgi:hypothetical protein